MEVWITCPDCGQKVLSNRLKAAELLRSHKSVCSLRVVPAGASTAASPRQRRPGPQRVVEPPPEETKERDPG